MQTKQITSVFKALRAENKSLNAVLRNLIEISASDKNAKEIATELGINASSIKKGAARDALRLALLNELPYYTTEAGATLPCNLRKVATVDDVTYYRYVVINWTVALQLICNRRAKNCDQKHKEVKLSFDYIVSMYGEEAKNEVVTYHALYKNNGATLVEDGETMLAVDLQYNKNRGLNASNNVPVKDGAK